jgi:hypothetical protein
MARDAPERDITKLLRGEEKSGLVRSGALAAKA